MLRPNDDAASVLQTSIQDLLVQRVQTACFRNRLQPAAPEPPQLTFDAAFFVAAGRVAVLALIAPVRPERNDAIRFDPLVSTQNLLHHRSHVVVSQSLEDAA